MYNQIYENLTLNDRVFHKGDIPMNIYYKENDDITQQDVDEFRAFVRQHSKSNGIIPTQEELDERVMSGELVYVHGYVKQDGTIVEGYYRRYPDRD